MTKRTEKIKVLIADGSEITRNGYEIIFSKSTVAEIIGMAKSDDEALELYRQLKPDAVMLDTELREKDGVKTCKELLLKNEAARVLLITPFANEDLVTSVLSSGAKALVLKDADHHELDKAILAVSNGGEYYSKHVLDIMIRKLLTTNTESQKQYWSNQFNEREIGIIQLTCLGLNSTQIGKKLNLSKRSIEVSRSEIFKKMSVNNIIGMIIHSYKIGLLDMDISEEWAG